MTIPTLRQVHLGLGSGTGLHNFIVAALCSRGVHGIYAAGACGVMT